MGWLPDLMWIGPLACAGLVLDACLGEPRRWHPLVGFGRLAQAIEARLNRGGWRRGRGVLAWCLVVLPLTALPVVALAVLEGVQDTWATVAGATLHAVLLYACLGLRSLHEHTAPIAQALQTGDLPQARTLTSRIVSRDNDHADASDLAKAGVESLLENGNDAVFGTLFWFAVAGGPGALLFRLANTLDAMWGYRSTRFLSFGWAAARLDDAMNYLPARLTAISYAVLGHTRTAWRCWRTQAPAWPSPNAGPVMAAGAGALQLALGRAATYDGVAEMRPPLGEGRAAEPADLGRAWTLVLRTALLWLAALLVLSGFAWWRTFA